MSVRTFVSSPQCALRASSQAISSTWRLSFRSTMASNSSTTTRAALCHSRRRVSGGFDERLDVA